MTNEQLEKLFKELEVIYEYRPINEDTGEENGIFKINFNHLDNEFTVIMWINTVANAIRMVAPSLSEVSKKNYSKIVKIMLKENFDIFYGRFTLKKDVEDKNIYHLVYSNSICLERGRSKLNSSELKEYLFYMGMVVSDFMNTIDTIQA